MFGAQIATRSPGSSPDATSARAASSTDASRSEKVSRVSPSTSPSRRPNRAAARSRAAGTVAGRSVDGGGVSQEMTIAQSLTERLAVGQNDQGSRKGYHGDNGRG